MNRGNEISVFDFFQFSFSSLVITFYFSQTLKSTSSSADMILRIDKKKLWKTSNTIFVCSRSTLARFEISLCCSSKVRDLKCVSTTKSGQINKEIRKNNNNFQYTKYYDVSQ